MSGVIIIDNASLLRAEIHRLRAELHEARGGRDLVPRAAIIQAVHRAAFTGAPCVHPEPDHALTVYREALERLATACTRNVTGQAGSCPHPQSGQPFPRDRWCSPCIAADALARGQEALDRAPEVQREAVEA